MSTFQISYSCDLPAGTAWVIAPGGLDTPHSVATGFIVAGGTASPMVEANSGQTAQMIVPDGSGRLSLIYSFDDTRAAPYSDEMFVMRASRFTSFADALVAEAEDAAGDHLGLARAVAIANATAERFTYGHPEARFNDGLDEIPALGCGLTEGSCVDINTYFIASLRAAGIEAGYVTGFFFPAEKRDHCEDGHCWVVTRIDGETHEWDIAHHLKLGTREIAPGLNPKQGFRAACFHSMGLDFPEIGVLGVKALIEPLAVSASGAAGFDAPDIRLDHPSLPLAEEVA